MTNIINVVNLLKSKDLESEFGSDSDECYLYLVAARLLRDVVGINEALGYVDLCFKLLAYIPEEARSDVSLVLLRYAPFDVEETLKRFCKSNE